MDVKNLTDSILRALEGGTEEWKKPWKNMADVGLPRNGVSNREYRGINILFLAMSGYADPRWYTFNQALEAGEGSHVKKGQKGTKIVFWSFIPQKDADGKPTDKKRAFLKVYTVFNAMQCAGIPPLVNPPVFDEGTKHHIAQEMVQQLGVEIFYGSDKASINEGTHIISMPSPESFNSVDSYLSTLFHEVAHWTAPKLGRDLKNRFGSDEYAMEELVAEITSHILCAKLGITGQLQHMSYISGWAKICRADQYAIMTATTAAFKAADYILSGGAGQEATEAEDEAQEAA